MAACCLYGGMCGSDREGKWDAEAVPLGSLWTKDFLVEESSFWVVSRESRHEAEGVKHGVRSRDQGARNTGAVREGREMRKPREYIVQLYAIQEFQFDEAAYQGSNGW